MILQIANRCDRGSFQILHEGRFAKGKDFFDPGIFLMVFSSLPLQSFFFSFTQVLGKLQESTTQSQANMMSLRARQTHGHRVSSRRCSKMERPPSLNATNNLRAAASNTAPLFIRNRESSRPSR